MNEIYYDVQFYSVLGGTSKMIFSSNEKYCVLSGAWWSDFNNEFSLTFDRKFCISDWGMIEITFFDGHNHIEMRII